MNVRSYLLIIFSFSFVAFCQAQVLEDAIRYSRWNYGGSARSVAIGGAIGALGSDFASLSTNPGGLGNYRKSEFVFTPMVGINTSNSTVQDGELGGTISDAKTAFGFQNVGFIFHKKPYSEKWKTFNVGIGFNQLANFREQYSFEDKTPGSVADRWLELAFDDNGAPIDQNNLDGFETRLAYDAFAIYDPFDDGYLDYTNDFAGSPSVLKTQEVSVKGSINELLLSMSGNYNNKFTFGATVGIPIANYTLKKVYEEEDTGGGKDGDVEFFNSMNYVENVTTSGLGFNIKAGVTVRVSQAFRVGFSAASPTTFTLTDNFYNLLTYSYKGNDGLDVNPTEPTQSQDGNFEYKIKTPFRVHGSLAYIIGRKGFISGDLEFVDYNSNEFDLTSSQNTEDNLNYQRNLNNLIDQSYKSAVNIRLGGEMVFDKIISNQGFDTNFSLGTGFRAEVFYFDLAYRLFLNNQQYRPYRLVDPAAETRVDIDGAAHQIITTFGFRF